MDVQVAPVKPEMVQLNPREKSRTYIYKSGFRHKLLDVVAVGIEKGWQRVQTGDGKLHIVYLIAAKDGVVADCCIAIELDCEAWTF